MDGPYLMANLPAGRYQIEASMDGMVRKQTVAIGGRGLAQTTSAFDTRDQVEHPSEASAQATDEANQATGITASGPGAGDSGDPLRQ